MASSQKRMRRALAAFGALVVACATASGAGASPSATYQTQMRLVGQELSASLLSIPAAAGVAFRYPVTPSAAQEAAADLSKGDSKLRDVTIRLNAITPPAAVAADHTRLTKATVQLNGELVPVIAKLRKGYLVAASALFSLPGVKSVNTAINALGKAGYRIAAT